MREITVVFNASQEESLSYCKLWRGQHLPISATTWCRDKIYLRLSGSEITLAAAQQKLLQQLIVEELEEGALFWQSIRNQTHDFFTAVNKPLWRLSLPINTPVIARFEGELLTEWGGTQRWVSNNAPANIIRAVVERHNGYATLFNAQQHLPEVPPFPILAPVLLALHKNLKRKLDPHNIFNPGRMYRDL
jgi:glycolate oxidase FAD binding subunit